MQSEIFFCTNSEHPRLEENRGILSINRKSHHSSQDGCPTNLHAKGSDDSRNACACYALGINGVVHHSRTAAATMNQRLQGFVCKETLHQRMNERREHEAAKDERPGGTQNAESQSGMIANWWAKAALLLHISLQPSSEP